MIAIEKEGQILIFNELPNTWENILNYPMLAPSEHYNHGWRDFVIPPYNPKKEYLGNPIIDATNDVFTYEVHQYSQQEIEDNLITASKSEKDELIVQLMKSKIENEAQGFTDKDAAVSEAIYPLWQEFDEEHRFEPPFKVKDFDENTNLVLYKAIQPNDKRQNTRPRVFPAGWTKIEYINGYEVWRQPIGGDGKYPFLDPDTGEQYLVTHNGIIWENQFEANLNVWEPTEGAPTLWKNVGSL